MNSTLILRELSHYLLTQIPHTYEPLRSKFNDLPYFKNEFPVTQTTQTYDLSSN